MPHAKPSLRNRVRYRVDRLIAAGPHRLLYVLGAGATALVAFGALALVLWGEPHGTNGELWDPGEAAWTSLGHTVDPSTIGYDEGWVNRLVLLVVAVGGLMCTGTLIGILSSATEERLRSLRRGRSPVIESGHTVVLGWSATTLSVLRELREAHADGGCATIVVLADRDKVEMEDDIRAALGASALRHIVVRSGDPIDPGELGIVSPATAASVVVLSTDDGTELDARTIRTLLALSHVRLPGEAPLRVTAELHHRRNVAAARFAGGRGCRLVVSDELLAQIAAQACRQPGLGAVYTDLLDFGGAEVRFRDAGGLAGRAFRDVVRLLPDECAIGFRTRDGKVTLLPAGDQLLSAEGSVVVLACDDAPCAPLPAPAPFDEMAIRPERRPALRAERTLVLGWNRHGARILRHLDPFVAAGSQVTVLTDTGDPAADVASSSGGLVNQVLFVRSGDPGDREALAAITLSSYDRALVLCCSDELDAHAADARALCTLLHLRSLCAERGEDLPVVSEMLDARNCELARSARVDDFIVSAHLVSLAITQIAENPLRADVLEQFLVPGGATAFLVPARMFVAPGREVTFATVVEAALRQGRVAIGWWEHGARADPAARHGLRLNPRKDSRLLFRRDDRVLVLARD